MRLLTKWVSICSADAQLSTGDHLPSTFAKQVLLITLTHCCVLFFLKVNIYIIAANISLGTAMLWHHTPESWQLWISTHISKLEPQMGFNQICVSSDVLIWMECSISATRATHKVWVVVLRRVDSHISACLVFLTQQWEIKCWKNLDLTSSCTVIPLYNNGKLQRQRTKDYTQLNNHFSKHMWLNLGCVLRIVLPSLRKRGGKERVCVKESEGERAQGDRGELLTVLCVCSRVAREQQMASLRVSLPWSVTLPLVVPLMLLSTKSTANRWSQSVQSSHPLTERQSVP